MSFWCLQFLTKNERKQVDLRFHSSKVEFVRSFFGRNVGLKKSFRLCLTFSKMITLYVSANIFDPLEFCVCQTVFFLNHQVGEWGRWRAWGQPGKRSRDCLLENRTLYHDATTAYLLMGWDDHSIHWCQYIIPTSLFYYINGHCYKFATSHKKMSASMPT